MDEHILMYIYTTLLKSVPEDFRLIETHMRSLEYLYTELMKMGLQEEADEVTDLYLLGYHRPMVRI